jgi:hypothetical protein
MKTTLENLVTEMTDFVNTFNRERNQEFCKTMSREHRTLQQSFTRLCLEWMEYVASDDFRTDPRNMDSHKTCKLLMELYRQHMSKDYSGDTLDMMSKPSKSLGTI